MAERRNIFRSIRTQLLIVNTLVLVCAFAAMSYYLVSKNSNQLKAQLKSEAQSFSVLATQPIGDAYSLYGESGTSQVHSAIESYITTTTIVSNVTIVDVSGQDLYSYISAPHVPIDAASASTFHPLYSYDSAGDLSTVVYPYFGASGAHSYSIVYSISSARINTLVRNQRTSLIVFSLLSLLVLSAVSYIAINRFIIRPIRDVSRQAAAIGAGDLSQEIRAAGSNEVSALSHAINVMVESLKENIAKLEEIDKVKSEFMAITSHNLRTPLTIMNSYLENLDLFETMDELKEAMRRVSASVNRLDGFAEDVLTISRFELGEHNIEKEAVALAPFLQKIARESESAAMMRELNFSADIATHASVLASPPHLRSAIWNLIDNAVKFTPKGGHVKLSAADQGDRVSIIIADDGIGITDEEKPKLFTKFHRGTSVEVYDYEGTGIGLYASKLVIDQLGGDIVVESTKGKGTTFTVTLPIAQKVA